MRKRTVDKIVRDCFWEGFQSGLSDYRSVLEYASTSGYYQYNGVRRIALDAGYDLAQQVLADAIERRASTERRRFGLGFEYKIPGSVYAECYGEAGIAKAVA